MTIYISTPGTYTLTKDIYEKIIIGADNVKIVGNNFTIHGDHNKSGNTIGILSSGKNTSVLDVNVEGFMAGIHLGGANSLVSHADVYGCYARGIGVAGGNGKVEYSTAGYIGGLKDYYGVTVGIVAWGSGNLVTDSNVHNIKGVLESCGYIINSGTLKNSLAQGQASTGWSFGLWGGDVTVDNSYLHSWADAIGGTGTITAIHSTIAGSRAAVYGSNLIDVGGSVYSQKTPNNAAYILGTAQGEHIVAGSGNNMIVGAGGSDVLFGGAGNDLFACSPYNALTCLPDFTKGQDKVSARYYYVNANEIQNGATATGNKATMLFNPDNHILSFDPDGGGAKAAQQIAYIPYAPTMQAWDFVW